MILKVLDVQKERIESFLVDSHRLMAIIIELKCELNQVKAEKNPMCKSVRMVNFGTEVLVKILMKGKNVGDCSGLGFSKFMDVNEKQKPHRGKK